MSMVGRTPGTSSTSRFEHRIPDILTWLVVIVSFVAGYVGYARRMPFFYPDSRYYLAMAYWFGGESQASARDLTVEFAQHYRVPVPEIDQLFGWGLVQPRVVLPLLAAIPVRLFGPFGLAATVLVIFVVMTLVFTQILRRRFGNGAAIAVMLLVNTSHFLMMFNGGMLTESLSALWTALSVVIAWMWMKDRRWWLLALLAGTVVGAAFTRQATFIVAGAFLMAWLLGSALQRRWNGWMWPAIVVAATSIACQLLQSVLFPSFSQLDQFLEKTGADDLGGAVLAIPRMGATIVGRDIASFLQNDVPLLVLILIAVAGMFVFFRRPEAHLLFGAILGVALYNITNGTPTQFRYAVPGLVFYALCAGLLISRATRSRTTPEGDRSVPAPSTTTPSMGASRQE